MTRTFGLIVHIFFRKGDSVKAAQENIIYGKSGKRDDLQDYAFIDLVNTTVDKNSLVDNETITVDYVIAVNDHHSLNDRSSHYIGVGVQLGEYTLWVKQQSFIFNKKVKEAG